jgi:hypothetical protein
VRAAIAISLLFVCASLAAWGQKNNVIVLPAPPPLATPEWLAPFPQALDQSAAGTSTQGTSAYTALASPADVISHYQHQMRTAGVTFGTKSDGIGISIEASAEKTSAVVRVREQDGATKVNVSFAVRQIQPPAPPKAPPRPSAQAIAANAQP